MVNKTAIIEITEPQQHRSRKRWKINFRKNDQIKGSESHLLLRIFIVIDHSINIIQIILKNNLIHINISML